MKILLSLYSRSRELLSFPTRRSSDLQHVPGAVHHLFFAEGERLIDVDLQQALENFGRSTSISRSPRSEEHTSELQSHVNLVCRLLLEKKKPFFFAESSTVRQRLHQRF